MEENKKKRVRPTLTQVRALENELKATKANYDNLNEKFDKSMVDYNKLIARYRDVCQSHDKLLKEKKELTEELDACKAEALRLKLRGFWSRLFNL